MPVYERPELPVGTKVNNLVAEGLGGQNLTPKTRVLIRNRGVRPFQDKFDGRTYIVPGGAVSEVEFEVADYLKGRSVVPGSRDAMTGKSNHFICILGIDNDEDCQPLDANDQAKADTAVEAIDRSSLDGPDRDVKVISTQSARARTVGLGSRRIRQSTETNDGTGLAPDALDPPVDGDAMRQIARDQAERDHNDE